MLFFVSTHVLNRLHVTSITPLYYDSDVREIVRSRSREDSPLRGVLILLKLVRDVEAGGIIDKVVLEAAVFAADGFRAVVGDA